jgi:hypothetical protein
MTAALRTALVMPPVPRQFALVLDAGDPRYEEYVARSRPAHPVVWWGCQVDGWAVLYRLDRAGRLHAARFASLDRALSLWRALYPVRVAWL